MRYGSARVSTEEQNLDQQWLALAGQGCAQVIDETGSGMQFAARAYSSNVQMLKSVISSYHKLKIISDTRIRH